MLIWEPKTNKSKSIKDYQAQIDNYVSITGPSFSTYQEAVDFAKKKKVENWEIVLSPLTNLYIVKTKDGSYLWK